MLKVQYIILRWRERKYDKLPVMFIAYKRCVTKDNTASLGPMQG